MSSTDASTHEATDVVICGCGPTGAMLSGYLSQMSIPHIVLEKEPSITSDPRGIALDEDGIRLIQGLGLYDVIYREIGTCMNMFKFIGGTEPDLNQKGFVEMDYATTEGGTGHVGFICHKQPILEKNLRKASETSPFAQLRSNCTVSDISEKSDHILCSYRDGDDKAHTIRARYLVGADGKTGFTRKNYLEPLGIQMEQAHQAFYDETWVALNWHINLPTPKTHPDFPLWALGYTPEQIYDLFFPVNFRFLCNPERPAVCGRFGLPEDRLWRFEFVVRPEEDGDDMATQEKVEKVVFPYLTHPGARYGLSQSVMFPDDCIQVLRCRPFRFSARSCNRWSHGRVALCGDSAHVFPPFGGQGIASGFRDASALAWRLALLCRRPESSKSPHETVFEGWYRERKQQLERSLASTITNGQFVTESRPLVILVRKFYLWFVRLFPSGRRNLRLGRRQEGLERYQYEPGMPFLPNFLGGRCLPQVYCRPAGQLDGEVQFTDDVIFRKKEPAPLLYLLVYLSNAEELPEAQKAVADVESISRGEVQASNVTFLLETDSGVGQNVSSISSAFTLATAAEFSRSPLCSRRPEPMYYDAGILGKTLEGRKYIILRADRFIYAACSTEEELRETLTQAAAYLQDPSGACE